MTAELLQPIDAALAADLASIDHSGTAIVSLGYDAGQIGHPLDGMGAVVPAVEQSPILACSFSSRKYPHRAPEGKELLRVFVGGARRPELAEMDDDRAAAAGARRAGAAAADSRRAVLLPHRPLARHDAAVSRRPQGVGRADRGPRGGAARICNWPATPITAWAFPTASTAASWRPNGLLGKLQSCFW